MARLAASMGLFASAVLLSVPSHSQPVPGWTSLQLYQGCFMSAADHKEINYTNTSIEFICRGVVAETFYTALSRYTNKSYDVQVGGISWSALYTDGVESGDACFIKNPADNAPPAYFCSLYKNTQILGASHQTAFRDCMVDSIERFDPSHASYMKRYISDGRNSIEFECHDAAAQRFYDLLGEIPGIETSTFTNDDGVETRRRPIDRLSSCSFAVNPPTAAYPSYWCFVHFPTGPFLDSPYRD